MLFVLQFDVVDCEKFMQEWFGLILFVILIDLIVQLFDLVGEIVVEYGVLIFFVYSIDDVIVDVVYEVVVCGGVVLLINFMGGVFVNQLVVFFDFYGMGVNLVVNVVLVDLVFVVNWFCVV